MIETTRLQGRLQGRESVNTLRQRQNGCQFPDIFKHIFKHIFLNVNVQISISVWGGVCVCVCVGGGGGGGGGGNNPFKLTHKVNMPSPFWTNWAEF